MFVCCECCVSSRKDLCDKLITCPEESYWLWFVVVCDLETSRTRKPWPALGCSTTRKQKNYITVWQLMQGMNTIKLTKSHLMHKTWNNVEHDINFCVDLYCGQKVCLKAAICYNGCRFTCYKNTSSLFCIYSYGNICLELSEFWILWELQEHFACIKCDHTIFVLS